MLCHARLSLVACRLLISDYGMSTVVFKVCIDDDGDDSVGASHSYRNTDVECGEDDLSI